MMRRENPISGGPTKGESIDAYSRGGPSRSSDEVLVMSMERRGWASSQRGAGGEIPPAYSAIDSDPTGETGIEFLPPPKGCGTFPEMNHKI